MEPRSVKVMTWAAVAILVVTDVAYLVLINSQGSLPADATFTVPFVAAYTLLMAGLLAVALIADPRVIAARALLRAGSAGGLLLLGTLAAFSIGLPILVAGALAVVLAARSLPRPAWRRPAGFALLAAVAAVGVLVGGLEVTQRMIVCPAQGTSGGAGSGLVSGPYHYECVNGVLSFHSGP
jgi:hypothetical protein